MDHKTPFVSIVIPCFNEVTHIEDCLQSILQQEAIPGSFEIIVADGMSNDGTREVLSRLEKQIPHLRVVDNPARIQSAGLNAALRETRGAIVIRMDAHTTYARDYVTECLNVMKESGADNVGGPVCTHSTGYIQRAISAAYHSAFSAGGARFHNPLYEGYVDTVPYGCWRREVFERIGLFDENLGRNEDDEFNLRLIRLGGKIWQSPRIKSWYSSRTSLVSLFRQYMQYGYWKVRLIQKHRIPASLRHVIPGFFLLSLMLSVLVMLVWPTTWWICMGILGSYSICNVFASIITARSFDWKLLAILPVVFACYHFGYASGFLHGIADFVVLRRCPASIHTALTRPHG